MIFKILSYVTVILTIIIIIYSTFFMPMKTWELGFYNSGIIFSTILLGFSCLFGILWKLDNLPKE